MYGNCGGDTLLGGAGNDTLNGGLDNNLFIDGKGKDNAVIR